MQQIFDGERDPIKWLLARGGWIVGFLSVVLLSACGGEAPPGGGGDGGPQEGSIERWVTSSSDDAEERESGGVNRTSTDLELIFDPDEGEGQLVGMRFLDMRVPQGAVITRAYVQFTAKEASAEETTLAIQAEAADDAMPFDTREGKLSVRNRTGAAAFWSPEAWEGAGDADGLQRTPDLSGVIQEVVDRPGWVAGNALAILISGSGRRVAMSFDGDETAAPQLHVEYDRTLPRESVTIVAAGDIACDPESEHFNDGLGTRGSCHMKAVADLVLGMGVDAVLPLGDIQYEDGTYEKFLKSYDPSWGRFKDITYPAVGNHEYLTSGAAGYFRYFGEAAGDPSKGYYSFDLGRWHFVVLNSQCAKVGGCKSFSPQGKWLAADLEANNSKCTLAYWHIPRFSSGEHGDHEEYAALWDILYAADADVVLVGHDHNYERFAPQDPSGAYDPIRGMRQFVVGTGGKSVRAITALKPNSEVFDGSGFGVLRLTLHPDRYEWGFVSEAGNSFIDSGSDSCH
ncbi:MAG: metallophosphoesterase [Trueperaceae bacterium]|nr:MAG: metallophosphoesterase [Trueperaceae bacterium]